MKSLIDYIILEELGISNDVISITAKLKSVIGKDYAQNYGTDMNMFGNLPISSSEKVVVFYRSFNTKFIDQNINITYYVLNEMNNKRSVINTYLQRYHSNFNIDTNTITLFLIGDERKIFWTHTDATIQHEIEHWYQQYRKGSELLSRSSMKRYKFAQKLLRSDNRIEKNIGFIYYYSEHIEHAAIMNGLYAKIMTTNAVSMIEKPEDILKEYIHYENIDGIRKELENLQKDEQLKLKFIEVLRGLNKSYESFIKLANKTVNEYIKGFGRTLYKAKKDLDEQYKNVIY